MCTMLSIDQTATGQSNYDERLMATHEALAVGSEAPALCPFNLLGRAV
jgi:hypothetical protein